MDKKIKLNENLPCVVSRRASYDSSIVGKANVGTMCSFMSSGGIVSVSSIGI